MMYEFILLLKIRQNRIRSNELFVLYFFNFSPVAQIFFTNKPSLIFWASFSSHFGYFKKVDFPKV